MIKYLNTAADLTIKSTTHNMILILDKYNYHIKCRQIKTAQNKNLLLNSPIITIQLHLN